MPCGKPLPRGPITTHRRRKGGGGQWGLWGTCPPLPPKIWKIFFGQLSCKIREFSGKYHKYHKYHPIKGLGERRKLPQRGPGQRSSRKWILCIFQVRKKPSGTLFSVFSSDGGAPYTSRGPEKLPPLSTGLAEGSAVCKGQNSEDHKNTRNSSEFLQRAGRTVYSNGIIVFVRYMTA